MAVSIISDANPNQLFSKGASLFVDMFQHVSAPLAIALCGGRSVVGLVQALAKTEQKLPWENFHFFLVDERLVPLTHVDSNFRLLNELLFEPLQAQRLIRREQVHPFVMTGDADFGTESYLAELDRFGGLHTAVLSSGEDGHVAALFPQHHSVEQGGRIFLTMTDSPKPPPSRMSASRELLLSAKQAMLLFLGEGKRQAYQRYLDPKLSWRECPAKLVDPVPEAYILTDIIL